MKPIGAFATLGISCALACSSSSSTAPLACAMSPQQVCQTYGPDMCELTWSAAQTDVTLCPTSTPGLRAYEYECGGYHVLSVDGIDSGGDSYYDLSSGVVVAFVSRNQGNSPTCLGGPSTGFVLPDGCGGMINAPPPPQCLVDGGSEDAATD